MFEIVSLSDADLSWESQTQPHFMVGLGAYQRQQKVHPKPMYPHDVAVVSDTIQHCEAEHPLVGSPSALYLFDRDFVDGFNGYAMPDGIYKRPDGSPWAVDFSCDGRKETAQHGLALGIALAGKSVPQIAAWTRYLVGHEYGHCAWYHARRLLAYGGRDYAAEADYMRVRGEPNWKNGKRWHQWSVEIIANDWRCLSGIEPQHWQHDVPHPTKVDAIIEWWCRAREMSAVGHPEDDHEAVTASRLAKTEAATV